MFGKFEGGNHYRMCKMKPSCNKEIAYPFTHSFVTHLWHTLLGRLYTSRVSQMFSQNTPQNTKHSLYTFRISCEFRISLTSWKNKLRNPLTFCANGNPGANCCETWKVKKVTQNTPPYTFHSLHFAIIFAYFAISA